MTDDALTIAEVAARLKCSTKHVRALIDAGRLEAQVIGFGLKKKRRRVAPAALARFMGAAPEGPRRGRLPPVHEYV